MQSELHGNMAHHGVDLLTAYELRASLQNADCLGLEGLLLPVIGAIGAVIRLPPPPPISWPA